VLKLTKLLVIDILSLPHNAFLIYLWCERGRYKTCIVIYLVYILRFSDSKDLTHTCNGRRSQGRCLLISSDSNSDSMKREIVVGSERKIESVKTNQRCLGEKGCYGVIGEEKKGQPLNVCFSNHEMHEMWLIGR